MPSFGLVSRFASFGGFSLSSRSDGTFLLREPFPQETSEGERTCKYVGWPCVGDALRVTCPWDSVVAGPPLCEMQ